jgi:hypothetical protein
MYRLVNQSTHYRDHEIFIIAGTIPTFLSMELIGTISVNSIKVNNWHRVWRFGTSTHHYGSQRLLLLVPLMNKGHLKDYFCTLNSTISNYAQFHNQYIHMLALTSLHIYTIHETKREVVTRYNLTLWSSHTMYRHNIFHFLYYVQTQYLSFCPPPLDNELTTTRAYQVQFRSKGCKNF